MNEEKMKKKKIKIEKKINNNMLNIKIINEIISEEYELK